jgi:CRISPR-associated endonuclease Csn1
MLHKMRYRLALDIGTTSIGWCLVRIDDATPPRPTAIIRAGVRLFNDGREPARGKGEVGTSLAVTRRVARQMRRRRDRMLRRKARIIDALVKLGFWPGDEGQRKALTSLDPYELRRKGLDHALTPAEFGRVLFHLNQRRGFLSNRKTDRKDNESGLLKSAIKKLREQLVADGARTVGEWLARRHDQRASVRARLRGKSVRDKAYDLYVDRAMTAHEFDALWTSQFRYDPAMYADEKRDVLRRELLHQRNLRPVKPGRCTLMPGEERAPLALPSVQRFRIYQELNNLRLLTRLSESTLALAQRDELLPLLEKDKVTFVRMRKVLGLPVGTRFNLEDNKRSWLNGNATGRILSDAERFGARWFDFDEELQDIIVDKLLSEPDEAQLVAWLMDTTAIDEAAAERIANATLPEGFGNLSRAAIALVLPQLRADVVTFDKAVERAGLGSHSALSQSEQTGEIFGALPYYGEALQRHVGFADPHAKEDDLPEKRFGRIANPTVHIGLNELRKVVNRLIERYGHPSEVVVEVARELKQGQRQRQAEQERQALRQNENDDYREKIRSLPGMGSRSVSAADVRRMRLWVELNPQDVANRRCPYSGEQIGIATLFSNEVEIEHILPFSMTLDDSLNNQTVALRRANRDKGNRTPHEAFGHSPAGYDYDAIVERASLMPKDKAKRFAADGYQRWLKEDKDFLARALTDTAYLSRVAKEYLSLVCPPNRVRVIPGRLTSMLRGKFGLNNILGLQGEKNRNDHRHHAVDAAVIGVTDQGLLQRFAQASAAARGNHLDRLVESMPLPWPTYREHVARAIDHIIVSHRPDHGHEGALHNDTAYGLRGNGMVSHRVMLDGFKSAADIERKTFADSQLQARILERTAGLAGKEFAARLETFQHETGVRRVQLLEKLSVIEMSDERAAARHGVDDAGKALAYKGYKGDSNHCIEIWRAEDGKWQSDVISTFEAHRIARQSGTNRLHDPRRAQKGQSLVMRLMLNDTVRLVIEQREVAFRVAKVSGNGQVFLAPLAEANVDARNRESTDDFKYVSKMAGSLKSAQARQVTVNEIGDLRDLGFKP